MGGSSTRRRARGGESSRGTRARFSSSSSFVCFDLILERDVVPRRGRRSPSSSSSSSSVALALGGPAVLLEYAGGGLTLAAGARGGRGRGRERRLRVPSLVRHLRRFSLSADADGEGWSSFVASAAVEARSASAASAANLLVALPLAPPPVAGALRAAPTGRRSPTAAGPGRAGLEMFNMASRARFPAPSAA